MTSPPLQDYSDFLNQNPNDGWVRVMGMHFTRATTEEVEAEVEIELKHRQAYGIVHGGVHCGIIETLASVGAALNAMQEGKTAVGLENHTSFIRATRSGKIRAVAKPLTRGRRSHVWEGTVYDDKGRVLATGRVRMMILEPDTELAGERVGVKG